MPQPRSPRHDAGHVAVLRCTRDGGGRSGDDHTVKIELVADTFALGNEFSLDEAFDCSWTLVGLSLD